MKNSTPSGIGTVIRRSVSILTILATLALTNAAKAADFKGTPSNAGAIITSTNSTIPVPASKLSQTDAGVLHLEASLHGFTAEPALYCFTDYGTFYMRDWVPIGAGCSVVLPYYPFIAYGIAG